MHEENNEGGEGDSGGPMYQVNNNGTARAAGITIWGEGLNSDHVEVCFMPITSVFNRFDAHLFTPGLAP